MSKYIVYTDGACKGNPGPASIGIAIYKGNSLLKEYSEEIGKATNNIAEYTAVLFALKKIRALYGKKEALKSEIIIKSDSKLLVEQLNGRFKLKNKKIQELFIEVWNLRLDFKKVSFENIPREENKQADSLANKALEGKLF